MSVRNHPLPHLPIIMLIIMLVAMSGLMGIDLHLASMPLIMKYLGGSKAQIKLSVSFYLLGYTSMLIAGPLSDKYGRKPIVSVGLLLASLASFATLSVHHINTFLVLRLLQGVGAGSSSGLARSIAVDLFERTRLKAIYSYFPAVIALSPLLAPTLGSYLQHYAGWQANFIFLSIFTLVVLVLYLFITPETNANKQHHLKLKTVVLTGYQRLFCHRVFVGAAIVGGVAMAVNIVYVTLSPFIFQVYYQLSPLSFGWIMAGVSIGILVGRFFNNYLVDKFGNNGSILLSIVLVLSAAVVLLINNLLHNLILLVIAGVFIAQSGQVIMRSNAMFLALLPQKQHRGAAGALFGSFQIFTGFLCGTIVSLFPHEELLLLSVFYLVLSTFAMIIYFSLLRKSDFQLS